MPVPWKDRREFEKTCEHCSRLFKTKKKTIRFCSNSCGLKNRSFDTRQQAISKALETWQSESNCPDVDSILQLSSRTVQKIMKRMNLPCSNCGGNKTVCDIHHMHGRKVANADSHEKLCYLCPNCHRLAHVGLLKLEDMMSLKDYIGDKWKEHFYGR